MEKVTTVARLFEIRAKWWKEGKTVGFVPTMGALHSGHLSLVERAKRENDRVVVSIFVNPTQFGPNEDFSRYPRTLDADAALLEPLGVECLFAPDTQEVYPVPPTLTLDFPELTNRLCGASRPGHFGGVLLVVGKLFSLVQPTRAYFGKKDYQQFRIVSRLAEDLSFPVEVIGCELVRDDDGLALSSRNRYLSPEGRKAALGLSAGLMAVKEIVGSRGEVSAEELMRVCREKIAQAGITRVEYIEVCDKISLFPSATGRHDATLVLVAAFVGSTRLIDNIEL